ncbi:site-specific integrase [Sporolactobacillus terrae]|uniref:Site-specific integrase n=1 Tax=Sporolactobacillus terrae TaxID=269673 RepID=A0A5K7WUT7_9BACL|nr:site-specific integrase [Sporolactobacillus terrae]BBN97449.1 site-specific integrase [Sporolactobacillus terrae]
MPYFAKYKTKDGYKWLFQMPTTVDPLSGKKKRTSFRGYETKREAQKAAQMIKEQLDKGTYGNDKITYREAYASWWDIHQRTLKPSTRDKSEDVFRSRILPHFDKLRIKDIDRDYCQAVVDKWREELTESTAKDYKGHASQVFKYAMSRDWIFKNPMQFAVVEKKDENTLADDDSENENFWDSEQFLEFQDTASKEMEYQDYVMFYVMGSSGLRKGEMLTLKWDDIDFENKIINVRRTLYFKNKKDILQKTKTGASLRSAPMTNDEIEVLNKWRTLQKERFLKLGIQYKKVVYVVCRDNLRPLRLAHPNEKLNKFLKHHPDLPSITVHGFRHTFASALYEAGVSVKTAQKFLGHTRMETTMNIYTHVAKTIKVSEADKYENHMKMLKQNR